MRKPSTLISNNQGIAATEFALIAPILVLLFLGVIELSNLLIADAKLRAVTSSLSDLVTQDSDGAVSSGDISLLGEAAKNIISPVSVAGNRLTVFVTDYKTVMVGVNPVSSIRWRRKIVVPAAPSAPNDIACNDGSGMPASLQTATLNDVVRVDGSFRWSPTFAKIFNADITITTISYNMPRFSISLPFDGTVVGGAGCT